MAIFHCFLYVHQMMKTSSPDVRPRHGARGHAAGGVERPIGHPAGAGDPVNSGAVERHQILGAGDSQEELGASNNGFYGILLW